MTPLRLDMRPIGRLRFAAETAMLAAVCMVMAMTAGGTWWDVAIEIAAAVMFLRAALRRTADLAFTAAAVSWTVLPLVEAWASWRIADATGFAGSTPIGAAIDGFAAWGAAGWAWLALRPGTASRVAREPLEPIQQRIALVRDAA